MVRRQAQRKKNEWPCGGCGKNCVNSCVFCAVCNKWFHCECEHLSSEDLKLFSEIPEDYICEVCRSEDGKFDFLMGIERIKKASECSGEKFRSVLRREAAIVADAERFMNVIPTTLTNLEIDPVGDKLLHHCHFKNDLNAVKSTGDGDCLFNAVSTLLVGDESLSIELRYKTCLEMFLNREKIQEHKDRASFHLLSPSYDNALKSCARPGQYSSVWTILGICNVIQLPMDILYPAVNGTKDLAFRKYNMSIRPNNPISNDPIRIMWSSTFEPRPKKCWTPNHLVPVVSHSCTHTNSVPDINFSFMFHQKKKSTPVPSKRQEKIMDHQPLSPCTSPSSASSTPTSSPFVPSVTFKKRPRVVSLTPSPECKKRQCVLDETPPPEPKKRQKRKIHLTPSPKCKKLRGFDETPSPDPKKRHSISPVSSPNSTFNSTLSLSNRFSVFEDDKDCVDEDCADEDDDVKDTPVLNPLPNNQFLNIDAAYQLIKASTPSNIEDKIPTGPKENIYILVKTTTNSKQEFPDDCGVWGRAGTTVNSTFIEKDGKLKTVVVRDSQICVERKVQNVRQYVPIVPQPADDSVVKCHRYYSKLKSSDQFKRRVTIFTKLPSSNKDKQDIAVVEYQGSWESPKLPHGNCTKASVPYRRTDPAILREAAHITKQHHQMPMTTCQQMMQNDSINAPRAKQIRDKVYRETKKTDSENFPLHNIADEVLCVINMCQNGENNVREIFLTPNKPPSVIVYSDEQLEDMKSNCIGPNGSVIGIDRTFNLGPCFVTTTTYKNVKILKRETLQNPIFLGPIFLHWDGETDSYFKFLCHLNSKLGFPSGLKVGSDEEKAIKNAINQSFHKPCHLLCTKHLKDNVRRYLKDKDGCRAKERETIVKSIFGHDGLLNSDDSFSFESKFADMDSVLAKFPNFQNHFQNRLKPLLHDHVFLPLQNGTVNELWTNNNSESLNNRIKQLTNWKPQKLPDLIHKLNEISSFQLNDLRRAIHGNGNYILDDLLTCATVKLNRTRDGHNNTNKQVNIGQKYASLLLGIEEIIGTY